MTVSLVRLDQLYKPDAFDDTKSAAAIAGGEASAVDYADFQEFVLSQIKRILHGDSAGNWHDDVATVHGGDASLKALYDQTDLAEKLIVRWKMLLQDITIPASQAYVTLTSAGDAPSEAIAIGALAEGAVVAQLAGAVGSANLAESSGENALKPKNLLAIFDGTTGDPLTSSNRRIWGLLQVGSAATDGNNFATTGNDLGQITFVRPNATYDDLELCPVADIENKTINYSYSLRQDMDSMPEDALRGDLSEADTVAAGFGGLDSAYDGGHFIEVDANDIDIRLADTKSFTIRKSGGNVLFTVLRTDAGSADKVQVTGDVDVFDVDAADSDFAQGIAVDTTDQAINIGKTAVGVIDSASAELRATAGSAEISATADVQFQTVRQTTAIPLDDATAGAISALAGGPHASISAAIKHAIESGGVGLGLKVFVAAANYAQGVNIPAATVDLTTYTIDMNTPANTDAFVFLNGRLLYGGNATTKNDTYVGDSAAAGDLKVDFPKGIKTGDVIITVTLA